MTFEHTYKILRRVTRRYVGTRFEHDELVNQAWLNPYVRNAEAEHKLVRATKNAIYDYIRHEIGRYKKHEPQRLTVEPISEDVGRDTWMDFEAMSNGLSRTKKLIIKLRADWFTTEEIAKIVGLSHYSIDNEMRSLSKDQKLRRCL